MYIGVYYLNQYQQVGLGGGGGGGVDCVAEVSTSVPTGTTVGNPGV